MFRRILPRREAQQGEPAQLGVRPEDLRLLEDGPAIFEGAVSMVEELGEVNILYFDRAGQEPLIAKVAGDQRVSRGQTVRLGAAASKLHVFRADGRSY